MGAFLRYRPIVSICFGRQSILQPGDIDLYLKTPMEPVLEIEAVSKSFWGIRALEQVSLSVQRGEVHAVTGENGAGKSTLMKIVAGIEQADSGRIHFHGKGIAMIHQELLPFREMSVAENICMGREPVR